MCTGLKTSLYLPPVVALIFAGVWIGIQRQSISALEKESLLLERHITTARASDSAAGSTAAKPAPPGKTAKDKEPLDWKKIAAQFAEMQQSGGRGDMRTMIKLQQRLQSMTQEEIIAALDEIAALDLPGESRAMLEQMLIGPLAQKEPELVLSKFIDRLGDKNGSMVWMLANAMQEWAKKDPAKAGAWFDQQIAAGKFESKALDGKSRSRNQFEGALISVLLGSDPAAAASRVSLMPEDQRDEVLTLHSFQQLKDGNQLAFAQLVRDQVPEKDQARTLARQASNMARNDEGYSKVTEYMDRIGATPAERAACVEEAGESKIWSLAQKQKIVAEDLDAMRTWAAAQSPGLVNTLTGKALANAGQGNGKTKYEDAAALAVHYHEASGNDEVMSSFLDGWAARQNKEQARVLAEKISDPKRRGEILEKLK
jgi:hypothetical protein